LCRGRSSTRWRRGSTTTRFNTRRSFWPRDHGKSEIFCISYPLRRICEDPNVRILIVQKTATEAEKTLGVIKAELESNEDLKKLL